MSTNTRQPTMKPVEAIDLMCRFDAAATRLTKAVNCGKGVKGAVMRHEKAAKDLFFALVGRKPTAEELVKLN